MLVLVLVVITTAVGMVLISASVATRGPEMLKAMFVAGFALLFAWIALSFWTGVFGFLLCLLRRHPMTLARKRLPKARSRSCANARPC